MLFLATLKLLFSERVLNSYKNFYLDTATKGLHPVTIVDYERIPYIYPYGDVRITFDKDVRFAEWAGNLFDRNLSSYRVIPEGYMILEVKFTEYLPEIIRDLLPLCDSERLSASKYVLCKLKNNEMVFHDLEG